MYLITCVCKKKLFKIHYKQDSASLQKSFFYSSAVLFFGVFFFKFRINLRRGFAGRGGGLHAWCSDLVHLHRLWQSRSRRVGGKAFHYFILRLKKSCNDFWRKNTQKGFDYFKTIPLHSLNLSPIDPRWVGAWWINFLIVGCVMMLITVPVLGFPKRLPGELLHHHCLSIQ